MGCDAAPKVLILVPGQGDFGITETLVEGWLGSFLAPGGLDPDQEHAEGNCKMKQDV
jgi:hypothetical protein